MYATSNRRARRRFGCGDKQRSQRQGVKEGDGQPVIVEQERAEILAALRQVTYVTIFDDISPRTLIANVLPDVLVKGGDYDLNEIHGREEVKAAGGKVVSLPFIEGASTSALIERMRKKK